MSHHSLVCRVVGLGAVLTGLLGQGCVGSGEGSDEQAATELTVGQAAHAELRAVAGEVTLGYFGEDSGSYCTAVFRTGPVTTFDTRTTLELLGFDADARIEEGITLDLLGDEFWQDWIDSQESDEAMAAAEQVETILGGENATALGVLVVPEGGFSAIVYLVAEMSDQSLLGLRGTVGGMSF
jgi:hypothetical protein